MATWTSVDNVIADFLQTEKWDDLVTFLDANITMTDVPALSVKGTLDVVGKLAVGNTTFGGIVHFSEEADAGSVTVIHENSDTATAGHTSEIIQIEHRHGGLTASRISTGKEGDFVLSADRRSFMAFTVRNNTIDEVMRLTSSGYLAVGNTAPAGIAHFTELADAGTTTLLHENSDEATAGHTSEVVQLEHRHGGYTASRISTGKEGDFVLAADRKSFMAFTVRSNTIDEVMRLTSAGKLAVGNTAPAGITHFSEDADAGTVTVIHENSDEITAGHTSEVVQLEHRHGSYTSSRISTGKEADFVLAADRKSFMAFTVRNNTIDEVMRLTSAGKLAVGNTAPAGIVHFTEDSDAGSVTVIHENSDEATAGHISEVVQIEHRHGGLTASRISTGKEADFVLAADRQSYMAFTVRNNSVDEVMRLTSAGKLAVGNTSPGGIAHFSEDADAGTVTVIHENSDEATASHTSEIVQLEHRHGGLTASRISTGKEGDFVLAADRQSYLAFTIRNNSLQEVLRIKSDRNILLQQDVLASNQQYLIQPRVAYIAIQGQKAANDAGLEIFTADGDPATGEPKWRLFSKGTPTDCDNSETLDCRWNKTSSYFTLFTATTGTGTARDLNIFTDVNNYQLYLKVSNGFTGFNENSPDARVHVAEDGADASVLELLRLTNNSAGAFTGTAYINYEVGTVSMARVGGRRVSGSDGELAFYTYNGSMTENMTLDKDGQLSIANNLTIGDGTTGDYTLTFDSLAADGVITWVEASDYFQFSDDIMMVTTEKIYFGSTNNYIYESGGGLLDVIASGRIKLDAPGITIGDAGTTVPLTFDGNTSDGVITWTPASNYFLFDSDLLLATSRRTYYRDTATYVYSAAAGYLDLGADTGVRIAGNTAVTGTFSSTGNVTIGDDSAADVTLTFDGTPGTDGIIAYNATSGFNLNRTVLMATGTEVQFNDANVNVGSGADGYLDLKADTAIRIASNDANYIEVEADGDVNFIADAGLQFGQIYEEGGSGTLALTAQDTFYQVVEFTANGESNGSVTPDHTNDHITVGKAGRYLVNMTIAFSQTTAVSIEYDFHVQINNGNVDFPAVAAHRNTNGVSTVGNCSGVGIIDLSASDTVEVWVRRNDGAAVSRTITFHALSLTLTQLGGTT